MAGTASLSFGWSQHGGPRDPRPPLAAVEHGSVPGGRPVLAGPLLPPSSAPQPTTTTPPPPPPPPPPPVAPPPTTRPPTSSAPVDPADPAAMELRVVELSNQERAAAGCNRPLVVDNRLAAAAQGHSTDMATRNYFSHTTPDGVDFAARITEAGYPRPAAENIAKGQRTAEQVMQSWMNSDGHRRNILNCEYAAIGVGLDTRGWYWTQDFGF